MESGGVRTERVEQELVLKLKRTMKSQLKILVECLFFTLDLEKAVDFFVPIKG